MSTRNLEPIKILFLCTGNSCRSQMAEGWARHLLRDRVQPHSAGVDPGTLDPRAVEVMAEVGIDISNQYSKGLAEVLEVPLDLVVTVCDRAQESCPIFPSHTLVRHVDIEDPPRLARHVGSSEEALDIYRRVRDQIRAFVETLPDTLRLDRA
ncbi:MAG: arsenate reductase ArsC [Acidobacteriota bacterium]